MKCEPVQAKPILLAEPEEVTKIDIEINVASLLEELKQYDALFHVELNVNGEIYHYSFIKRDITESVVMTYMFVKGVITSKDVVQHTVQISYISKE